MAADMTPSLTGKSQPWTVDLLAPLNPIHDILEGRWTTSLYFPRIADCDVFRAFLYYNQDVNLAPELPPRFLFDEVYQAYIQHNLTMIPTPSLDFEVGEDPFPLINGQSAPYWIFVSVLNESGGDLTEVCDV